MQSDYDRPDLIALSKLDDAAFRIFFAGTPIKRAGRDNFIRNVLMALGNMDIPTPAHIAAVRARLEDEAELVRASAIWALGQMTDMSGAEILNMVGARGPLVDEELAQLGN